jgi:hypothetical protein
VVVGGSEPQPSTFSQSHTQEKDNKFLCEDCGKSMSPLMSSFFWRAFPLILDLLLNHSDSYRHENDGFNELIYVYIFKIEKKKSGRKYT